MNIFQLVDPNSAVKVWLWIVKVTLTNSRYFERSLSLQDVHPTTELIQLEHEHKSWLTKISQKDSDINPIGKTATEREEDDEEEEDEDDSNDDEESESQDEEDEDMEVDVSYDRGDPAPSVDS
ncbi:hypothetical protein GE061_018920 [Apolygus lucorum]|uniref:Uncharacterized protein n=1 Tax=Apolygus lucorum TaxID=248454 RepID=A0A6A4JPB7_APOLU|nr:hypothetical protein GE061_018920 [Apolygus lucorum]